MKLQKETAEVAPHGKWYSDACGTAFALELIGERWSMLIIRELMLGGRRFSDLRESLPGISAKVLSERLATLEGNGVVTKRKLPPPAATQVYELTEWGYLAEPALLELSRWATRSPQHNPRLPLSPVAFMLSLRTMIDPVRARELEARIGFTIRREGFLAELAGGHLAICRGDPAIGEAVFSAPEPLPLLRVFYGKHPLAEIEQEGQLHVTGDRALAGNFVALFGLPPKIGAAPSSVG